MSAVFVTVLTVTLLSEGGKDYGFQIPYESRDKCELVVGQLSFMYKDFPDAVMKCEDTRILSISPYPRAKP